MDSTFLSAKTWRHCYDAFLRFIHAGRSPEAIGKSTIRRAAPLPMQHAVPQSDL